MRSEMISPLRRGLAVVSLLALPLLAAGACGGENTKTDCNLNSCTVTFDRGVEASASILGIEAELVTVQGNKATMKIAGQQVTIPADGHAQVNGYGVAVQEINDENVVVKISAGDGG